MTKHKKPKKLNKNKTIKNKRVESRKYKKIRGGGVYIEFDDEQKKLFKTESINNYEEIINIFSTNYEKNIINEKKMLELTVTLSYLWALKIYFVIVSFENSRLTMFSPCINLSKNTIVKSFLHKHQDAFNDQKRILKEGDKEYLEKEELVTEENAILDQCILYPLTDRNKQLFNHNEYFHYGMYLNMFYNLSQTDSFKTKKVNTCFLFNLFDNPVIIKKLLNTNSLLTTDSANGYSDKICVQTDAWMRFFKQDKIIINTKEYKITNHYKPIEPLINKFLNISENELIENFNTRKEKMIVRGSLTGCNPANINLNARYKVVNYINTQVENKKDYDIGITKMQNSIYIENPLYDNDDFNIVNRFDDSIINIISSNNGKILPMNDIMSGYKFVLSLDGYVSAWRLPYELLMGNIVFLITKYNFWFKHLLEDGVNCIMVDINQLDNLDVKLQELIKDKNKQESICKAANKLGKQLLNYNFIMENLENTIILTQKAILNVKTIEDEQDVIAVDSATQRIGSVPIASYNKKTSSYNKKTNGANNTSSTSA